MTPGPSRIGVSGIVLAGGRSSRFAADVAAAGSKLDADLGGLSVLDRTIEAIRPVVDDVLVVGRSAPRDERPGPRPGVATGQPGALRFVDDREPFGGPVAGLLVGLEACRGDIALVVGGDMPLLKADVLRLLIERLRGEAGFGAVRLAVTAGWQPLPLALRREPAIVAASAALAANDRSLVAFIRRLRHDAVEEATWRAIDPEGDTIADVDTGDDLVALRRRL